MSQTPNLAAAQTEELDYGPAQLREFFFKYDGNRYVLVEAKGNAVIDYRDSIGKQVKVSNKVATNDGAAKFEPLLLARCVFQLHPDNSGNRIAITADWCRALPNHIFKDLFSRLEKMSGLADDRDDTLSDRVERLEEELKAMKERQLSHEGNGQAEGNALSGQTR